MNEGKSAEEALKLLIKDTVDEEILTYRRKLLRFWPDPPAQAQKLVAEERIK